MGGIHLPSSLETAFPFTELLVLMGRFPKDPALLINMKENCLTPQGLNTRSQNIQRRKECEELTEDCI
jgi:hypothetical protein